MGPVIFVVMISVLVHITLSASAFSKNVRKRADIGYELPEPPVYGAFPAPLSSVVELRKQVQNTEHTVPAEEPVDLHNSEFCVDISTYQPVVWVEMDGEGCHTNFIKKCKEKSEDVCADVTETRCEVIPYTECSMGQEPQQFSETKLAPKQFIEKACTQGQKSVPHQKLLPECRNVTKQNCVTLWEKDQYGKQVWAGQEGCEPVTWQECKLVPKDVQFIVPEITCSDKQELWYHEPEEKTDTRMTNTFACQVKSTSDCKSSTRQDCKKISWNECREVPVTNCSNKSVHVPTQELLHRKKCLLPDKMPSLSYGSPTVLY